MLIPFLKPNRIDYIQRGRNAETFGSTLDVRLLQLNRTWRVQPAGLQVTRAIGDFDCKGANGVIAQPEITYTNLTPDDEFVVMACDGVWDVMTEEEVVEMIYTTVKEPSMCAKRLGVEAMNRGSGDNITVIVCFLRPVSTVERIY